jgi:hypothetical protein
MLLQIWKAPVSAELQSILIGTIGLSVAAIAAAMLAMSRQIRVSAFSELNQVRHITAIAIVLQSAHFTEEWYSGFHKRFPEMLGLVPWPSTFFALLNLIWIGIWCVSTTFLGKQPRALLFPIWFLAIASAVNGIAHPVLSVLSAGYFPGLWSSPFVGVAGVLLLRALSRLTSPSAVSHHAG